MLVCDCVIHQDGMTPLYAAAFNGHLEVCRVLLDKGADANQAEKKVSAVVKVV
jgi:ankyrin repeat protein